MEIDGQSTDKLVKRTDTNDGLSSAQEYSLYDDCSNVALFGTAAADRKGRHKHKHVKQIMQG